MDKEQSREEEIEEKVWREAFTPRTLRLVSSSSSSFCFISSSDKQIRLTIEYSHVSDRQLLKEVEGEAVVRHGSVTGIRTDLSGPNTVPEILDPRNDTPEKKRGSE